MAGEYTDSRGTVGVLRKCIETVRRQQQDEYAMLHITSDVLSDLLRVVEAVERMNPFRDMSCVFCECDEFGPRPRDHAPDCAWMLADRIGR